MSDSNPNQSTLDDDVFIADEERQRLNKIALELRRNGATQGMIVKRLAEESVSEAAARTIAARVIRRDRGRHRLLGVAVVFVGVACFTLGICVAPFFLRMTVPLSVAFLGIIVVCIGVVQTLGKTSN